MTSLSDSFNGTQYSIAQKRIKCERNKLMETTEKKKKWKNVGLIMHDKNDWWEGDISLHEVGGYSAWVMNALKIFLNVGPSNVGHLLTPFNNNM